MAEPIIIQPIVNTSFLSTGIIRMPFALCQSPSLDARGVTLGPGFCLPQLPLSVYKKDHAYLRLSTAEQHPYPSLDNEALAPISCLRSV